MSLWSPSSVDEMRPIPIEFVVSIMIISVNADRSRTSPDCHRGIRSSSSVTSYSNKFCFKDFAQRSFMKGEIYHLKKEFLEMKEDFYFVKDEIVFLKNEMKNRRAKGIFFNSSKFCKNIYLLDFVLPLTISDETNSSL